jgi:hypothetical protein
VEPVLHRVERIIMSHKLDGILEVAAPDPNEAAASHVLHETRDLYLVEFDTPAIAAFAKDLPAEFIPLDSAELPFSQGIYHDDMLAAERGLRPASLGTSGPGLNGTNTNPCNARFICASCRSAPAIGSPKAPSSR